MPLKGGSQRDPTGMGRNMSKPLESGWYVKIPKKSTAKKIFLGWRWPAIHIPSTCRTLSQGGLQPWSLKIRNRSMATQNSYGLGMTPVNEYITTKCLIFGRVVRCSKDMGYTGASPKNY